MGDNRWVSDDVSVGVCNRFYFVILANVPG